MKTYFGLPEALIEHLLVAVRPLNGVEQVHVIRHGDLKQSALDFNLVGHRAVEFVIGAADVRPVLLLAIGGRPARAFELDLIEQRCFRMSSRA